MAAVRPPPSATVCLKLLEHANNGFQRCGVRAILTLVGRESGRVQGQRPSWGGACPEQARDCSASLPTLPRDSSLVASRPPPRRPAGEPSDGAPALRAGPAPPS
eukprot:12862199-Alexandrium_andersonii.AAC.1